ARLYAKHCAAQSRESDRFYPNGVSSLSPGLRVGELPWVHGVQNVLQPQRGCGSFRTTRHNSVGVGKTFSRLTQGSSFVATLGFEPESLWDSCRAPLNPLHARRFQFISWI